MLAPVPMGVEIVSRTQVVGQRRVWARRRGEFITADGTLVAWVHTDWVMIDARALTRIPEIFGEAFRIPEASGQIGRVALPPTPDRAVGRSFAVRPHELDPMDHVNNAVYLDWLEECLLPPPPPRASRSASTRSPPVPPRVRRGGRRRDDLSDAAWREPTAAGATESPLLTARSCSAPPST